MSAVGLLAAVPRVLIVTMADSAPCVGNVNAALVIDTLMVAGPVPEIGVVLPFKVTHGWVADAVHDTVPAPACVSRTCCGGV